MTAKEEILFTKLCEYGNFMNIEQEFNSDHREVIFSVMNQFALHIAKQAEKKLRIKSRNEPKDSYKMGYLDGASDMVSRIKTLTEHK